MSIVALEVAESEIARFAELMGLDFDVTKMDEGDLREFNSNKDRLVMAICAGNLTFNDIGEPTYTCKRGDKRKLTFKEGEGSYLMVSDKHKSTESVASTYAVMGEQTGENPKTFATMKMQDLKVCMSLTGLLMG